MNWIQHIKECNTSWLLTSADPGVRWLALRDLTGLPATNPELKDARRAAHQHGPIAAVLAEMHPEGYWMEPGPGYNPKYFSTVWALVLLAQLGARVEEDERIERACRYLCAQALTEGGRFSATGAPSGTADCLQGNLCWAMLELGYADERLDLAFDWMSRSITGEGIASCDDRKAGLRYYAGKCGPDFACGANNRLPCAWGGVKVMLALGKLPYENRTPNIKRAIQRGIDFFFSVDPASGAYPSGYSAKPSQNWWKFGMPVFYVTDLLQAAEALGALGLAKDPRMNNLLELIWNKRDAAGRWALGYDYAGKTWVDFGPKNQPNPWVTLRALHALNWALK